jgi:hypothetical protein
MKQKGAFVSVVFPCKTESFLEKIIRPQLVKKYPTFVNTHIWYRVYKMSLWDFIFSQFIPVHFSQYILYLPSHSVCIRSILISHLWLSTRNVSLHMHRLQPREHLRTDVHADLFPFIFSLLFFMKAKEIRLLRSACCLRLCIPHCKFVLVDRFSRNFVWRYDHHVRAQPNAASDIYLCALNFWCNRVRNV